MPTRVLVAYAIIAALLAAGFALLWFKVLRHRLALRRGRIRDDRARRLRNATRRPVTETV